MITYSRLGFNGRFGNQLFQFAGTIGIAEKNGLEVTFPTNKGGMRQRLSNGNEFIARVDIMNCFDIEEKVLQ